MRARFGYLASVAVAIALGLSVRAYSDRLPAFLAEHAGDALWAAMIYAGLRMLFIRRPLGWTFSACVCFCFAIEFSQLYQAGWINDIRATVWGALILGKGFLAIDLVRYACGAAAAYGLDRYLLGVRKPPLTGE